MIQLVVVFWFFLHLVIVFRLAGLHASFCINPPMMLRPLMKKAKGYSLIMYL